MPDIDRTVIITGAGQGIGAATAVMAAASGYQVCINYRQNRLAAEEVLESIIADGGRGMMFAADVGNEAEVAAMFDATETKFGPVSALVNNAGILQKQTNALQIDTARFRGILRTNLLGAFHCCKEAIARMSTENGGSGGAIVNVSSVAARTGAPFEYVDYAASKGALDTLTKGLAREAATVGVRVNTVQPGLIYTAMHAKGGEAGRVDRLRDRIPMRRGGQPDEVARAVLWLLSDQAAYAVGTTIAVTGGV
jgi:NAD(P)-dependent dehydrogenase (short-subunit alcohol dehydrogenase family)